MIGRPQPGFEKEPARPDHELAEQVQLSIQGDRLLAAKLEINFQMILQITPDTGQVVDNIHTGLFQHIRWPNP